jgi:hypothetical protein
MADGHTHNPDIPDTTPHAGQGERLAQYYTVRKSWAIIRPYTVCFGDRWPNCELIAVTWTRKAALKAILRDAIIYDRLYIARGLPIYHQFLG